MTRCPTCKHGVSAKAVTCPGCGHPLRDPHRRLKWLVIGLLAVLASFPFLEPGCQEELERASIQQARDLGRQIEREEEARERGGD